MDRILSRTAAIMFCILTILLPASGLRAAEGTPAGYITDLSLTGADEAAKTVVVRDGAEIPARLMMPLYAGDVVFIREPLSSVGVETGAGKTVTLGADLRRYAVEGEIDTGDSTWGILGAISGVIAGEGKQAPENMVSKGSDLKMPMVVRGSNMIDGKRTRLWLGWEGGAAPYAVAIKGEAGETVLATGLTESSTEISLPPNAGDRFTLVINDSRFLTVTVKVKRAEAVPALPGLAGAAKLTGEGKGQWTLEAAQRLREQKSAAAAALLEKVRAGWRLGG